jgi:arylsulfatase A-like enzyme
MAGNISRRQVVQAGALWAITAARRSFGATRPNILIITTDQQFGDAMSCRIGERYLKTPHMDSLAANGTLFSRAYCANPLCVPSRTSIFTGRYPVETGVETNDTSEIDARRFPCLGTIFQRAGYATGYFGKWHLPFAQKNPAVHGFDTVDTTRNSRDANTAEKAAAFIKTKRSAPFLLVASFLNPHNICQWPRGEDFSEGDPGTPPPLDQCPPRRANGAPQENEPDIVTTMRHSYQATPMFPVGKFDEKRWRQYQWAYYRLIEKADARIGQVLKALRDSGLENDTLVVFSADHGDCQGAHGWNQKTILFEEAARVPCILSWKGVTKAAVSDRLVHTGIDFLPTLCDYAGISRPARLPGMSLKAPDAARKFVVVSNHMVQGAAIGGRKPEPQGRMLRSERYKYTVYSEGARRESLVDLSKDPGEMVNLAGKAEFAPVLAEHRKMLAQWCRQYGDRFPVAGESSARV